MLWRVGKNKEFFIIIDEHAGNVEIILYNIDKRHAKYYEYYTNRKWGMANNYHIAIDRSRFDTNKISELLTHMIKNMID